MKNKKLITDDKIKKTVALINKDITKYVKVYGDAVESISTVIYRLNNSIDNLDINNLNDVMKYALVMEKLGNTLQLYTSVIKEYSPDAIDPVVNLIITPVEPYNKEKHGGGK